MMKRTIFRSAILLAALSLTALSAGPANAQGEPGQGSGPGQEALPERETNCSDGIDNDKDGLIDCADADCYDSPDCKPNGDMEETDALCSDWIDNDGDGVMDCDDPNCYGPGVTVCRGSYREPAAGAGPVEQITLPPGVSAEDFLSAGNSDVRFSVVAQISQSHYFDKAITSTLPDNDTTFSVLQLRAMGPIRGIHNSFFLVSMRAEKTPRLTFAMFQIPVGDRFYFNVNSGGGGLSAGLIKSAAKRPLIDPAYYLYSSFEQGNGAAADFGGAITNNGTLRFRTYVAGGSGRFNGNVGGRYFREEDFGNYTYSFGGQVFADFVGHTDRLDSTFLYTPAAAAATLSVGAKYDQRSTERYPAVNGGLLVRYKRFILEGETYYKNELEFKSTQLAYNVTAGVLLVPKWLFFAADYGAFLAGDLGKKPQNIMDAGTDVRKQRDEWQARGALHLFFYRNVGVASVLFSHREVKKTRDQKDGYKETEGRLVGSYWF